MIDEDPSIIKYDQNLCIDANEYLTNKHLSKAKSTDILYYLT